MVDLTTTHLARHGIDVRHADTRETARDLLQRGLHDGVIIDIKARAAYDILRLVRSVDPPLNRVWLSAWTEDHQVGYILQLDAYVVGSGDATVAMAHRLTGRPSNKTVVAYAESEAACRQLRATLSDHGYDNIKTVSGVTRAIGALSSEKAGYLFVDLAGFAADTLHLVERVRQIPEWASVRIIGVVPSAARDDEREARFGASDEFVRRHGVTTPTLLLDIAEKLMARHAATTVGACI